MSATIVLIDDEQAMIELLSVEFASEGFGFAAATSGRAGLEMVRKMLPDLVLLDVMLPDLNGYDVLRILKHDPAIHMIPVIMLTAKSLDADIQRGLELGADDYVTKPFHAGLLIKRIRAALHHP